MDSPFDMSVKVTRGPSATICDFSITDAVGITKTFTGEAKKHPTDEYDQQIGDMYSFLRALRAAADYIEAGADELVRIANDQRKWANLEALVEGMFKGFEEVELHGEPAVGESYTPKIDPTLGPVVIIDNISGFGS